MKARLLFWFLLLPLGLFAQDKPGLEYMDVFDLSYVSDPQISPDGNYVVYRKMDYDVMKDRLGGSLWIYSLSDGSNEKLTTMERSESNAIWSPKGDKIYFTASTDEGGEIYTYWMDSQKWSRISQLPKSPGGMSLSPSGKYFAFYMSEDLSSPSFGKMPKAPKGAKWAAAPRVTDRLKHEADGRGYIKPTVRHIYVLPVSGGHAEQITSGSYSFGGAIAWDKNERFLISNSNIKEDADYDFRNSELYKIDLNTKEVTALTDNVGPDYNPVISPDGAKMAYLSYTDKVQAYQVTELRVMDLKTGTSKALSSGLDRSVSNPTWLNNEEILFNYDDHGDSKLAKFDQKGDYQTLFGSIGGTTLGRPYASGSYSSNGKTVVYTEVDAYRPAFLGIFDLKKKRHSSALKFNEDLLGQRALGKVEEVNYKSAVDGRDLQGWIVYPSNYDASKSYPLLVENHGGPILNYGPRFSIEMQWYAAAGYMVFYPNARGSTGYGEEFGNLLYRNYPGEDYNDVIDGVDYLIEKGLAHEDQLFVTGGSAGGLMAAWMVGKSNRFEAAVVVKPVVNWISKTLVADNYYGYANSRYEGQPWENPMHYWKFSPISLVGQIETPTMVMVGMNDLRTPPSEAKQLYHALKLRKVPTVLVEIPGASHGIASRPSNMIRKIVTTLAWFEPYKK